MTPATAKTLFSQHSRNWRSNRYVYPVISRRSRGLSIGINLNPDKICNFDCIYCCVDRTGRLEPVEVDLAVLEVELRQMLAMVRTGVLFQQPPFDQAPPELRRLNDVAFSGDGEPTSFSRFGEACELAASAVRDAGMGEVKLVVITNATLLHQPRVQNALAFLDQHNGEIWAKLDAGTEAHYRLVERTTIPMRRVLDNILAAGRARPIVIQSLFMKIHGTGPDEAEIAAYIQRLRELIDAGCQIKLVQVYTVARTTAEAHVTPLNRHAIDMIAQKVTQLGLQAEAFYGPD